MALGIQRKIMKKNCLLPTIFGGKEHHSSETVPEKSATSIVAWVFSCDTPGYPQFRHIETWCVSSTTESRIVQSVFVRLLCCNARTPATRLITTTALRKCSARVIL